MDYTQNRVAIRRALISVSAKSNLENLAEALKNLGAEILSTGGTADYLKQLGYEVTEVSEYTQFPEMMGGRLKTLHPRIHGALLGRTDVDHEVMQENGIEAIDLLVVNLYPFEETVQNENSTLEEAIENIDIGGPAMVRAASKNHDRVTVMVDPKDYAEFIDEVDTYGGISHANRHILAAKAFAHTARYDGMISNYLSAIKDNGEKADFPKYYTHQFKHRSHLRYGENPHQKGAFYTEKNPEKLEKLKKSLNLTSLPLNFSGLETSLKPDLSGLAKIVAKSVFKKEVSSKVETKVKSKVNKEVDRFLKKNKINDKAKKLLKGLFR